MLPYRLLVASNNPHKVREFHRILHPLDIEILTPASIGLELKPEETGTTFAENAILKATAFSEAGRLPAVADDSGLVVDALGGQPGIYSARYGGPGLSDEDRTSLVLQRLSGVPPEERTGRFVCAVALAAPGLRPRVFEGSVEGTIAEEPAGPNGFGYDPIFFYPPFGSTFGQAKPEDKDAVSHRGRALRALADYLASGGNTILGQPPGIQE